MRTIANGEIGPPRLAIFQLQLPTLADPEAELPAWWEDAGQGGGWLGAYGSHVIDQIRSTLGEFEAVSATLQTLAPRPSMTADDTYTVQFRLVTGVEGVMHSSCAVGGQFLGATKITGTAGSAWLQGDDVWVDDGTGPRQVPVPDDLVSAPPDPPPSQLLHTAYDMWHSMGIDLDPYTKLYATRAGAGRRPARCRPIRRAPPSTTGWPCRPSWTPSTARPPSGPGSPSSQPRRSERVERRQHRPPRHLVRAPARASTGCARCGPRSGSRSSTSTCPTSA